MPIASRAKTLKRTGCESARLSPDRHARGCTQGVSDACRILVVENLPREHSGLPRDIDDPLARLRRKTIGLIGRRRIRIGIASGSLPPAPRVRG
jgi:hypothetical protein